MDDGSFNPCYNGSGVRSLGFDIMVFLSMPFQSLL